MELVTVIKYHCTSTLYLISYYYAPRWQFVLNKFQKINSMILNWRVFLTQNIKCCDYQMSGVCISHEIAYFYTGMMSNTHNVLSKISTASYTKWHLTLTGQDRPWDLEATRCDTTHGYTHVQMGESSVLWCTQMSHVLSWPPSYIPHSYNTV